MLVELLSENGKYVDKNDGKEKGYTNFFLQCGNERVPIEVKYFGNDEKRDNGYSGRKAILRSFATQLPDKVPVTTTTTAAQ